MGYAGEKKRDYQRRWLKARRDQWIKSQGGRCCECGSRDNLEIDHVDRTNKSFPVATLWSRAKHIRESELMKCQVLCEICHKKKSSKESTFIKHGTINTYERHKCRCVECREAKSVKNKLRRRRKERE